MDNTEYKLRYLPLFEQDFAAARRYIERDLQSPGAALRLINDTDKAIKRRLDNPLSFEPLRSVKNRKHLYYPIYIRNFIVLYVVIDDVMEVRRFVYGKRDMTKI